MYDPRYLLGTKRRLIVVMYCDALLLARSFGYLGGLLRACCSSCISTVVDAILCSQCDQYQTGGHPHIALPRDVSRHQL